MRILGIVLRIEAHLMNPLIKNTVGLIIIKLISFISLYSFDICAIKVTRS